MHAVARSERETVIFWDGDTKNATIDTADPATIRKLDKLAADHPEAYRLVSVDVLCSAKRYEMPARLVWFGMPATQTKQIVPTAKNSTF